MPTDAPRPGVTLLCFVGLAAVVGLNWWLFPHLAREDYFAWYLDNGPALSLGLGFTALIVEGLALEHGLISAHPVRYIKACRGAAGIFIFALGTQIRRAPADRGSAPARVEPGQLWDMFAGFLLIPLIVAVVLAWLVVIAPLNYFVTLFSGALARQGLSHQPARTIVQEKRGQVTIAEQPPDQPARRGKDVSLTSKPIPLTQAITAVILWLVNFDWHKFFS